MYRSGSGFRGMGWTTALIWRLRQPLIRIRLDLMLFHWFRYVSEPAICESRARLNKSRIPLHKRPPRVVI